MQKRFRLVDNIFGWLAFAIAAFVYCSTIEPTASFWDCPEFITTGYKLEVGHPPGAPFFMLTANLFSQFASDPSQVARMVNIMSALLSAATILFLFWSISHLTRKLLVKDHSEWSDMTLAKMIAIEGSAMVGALIYTFSDTFWFSAVEGEVYAYSSAFTAVVFWLILKWEDNADRPHSDRWLVLIFYLIGLSIGVHLLNLLCIPAIVLVFYYRKFYPKTSRKDLYGSLIALAISVVIVAAVLYGVVPGIVKVGGWFELFFVNTLGLPFNSGEIVYIALLVATIIWAIYETQTDRNPRRQNIAFLLSVGMLGIPFYGKGVASIIIGIVVLAILWIVLEGKIKKFIVTARMKNTSLLCMLMLMIGYSSYAVIVIRSSANPPMDQNSPEDIFTLGEYLSREQYGNRPLFYGQAYTSQVAYDRVGNTCIPQSTMDTKYRRKEKTSADEKDSYYTLENVSEYHYAQNMLFPRMYSSTHASQYESWMGGVEGTEVPYDRCGEMVHVKVPTQLENLRFFLSYQCNWMYWRYFMWNFAGRQNDLQGHGDLIHGNWLSGIPFIDNLRLGNQELLPDDLKDNAGHNVFYCLPLLLGLIGLFWQSLARGNRGVRQFWVVGFLFFMTGLAIVIYLNQTPSQPRERDYAYAGSFYAFAIWCGMGVAAIIDLICRKVKQNPTAIAAAVSVACLLVPIQMASQTWDDHDRSGRYCCRDFGQNYLNCLQEGSNPIIFTNGDNDTFPLWYNQDTENFRTDARVCNLSYLNTDWYIDQMVRPAYDSPALPITWNRYEYVSGTNEYIRIEPRLKEVIEEFYADDPALAKQLFGENPFELSNVLKVFVRNSGLTDMQMRALQYIVGEGQSTHIIPTDVLYMTVDKEAVKKSGMLMATDSIPDKMEISLRGRGALYKGDLMMLEIISNANWVRPIYVASTVGADNFMNLGDNFVMEGLVNRITPFTTTQDDKPIYGVKNFDTEKVYTNFMKKFKFGGINEGKKLYMDETIMRMCAGHRRLAADLAWNLAEEGDSVRAIEVLQYADKNIPELNVPHDYYYGSLRMADIYAMCGHNKEAMHIINQLWKKHEQYIQWYLSLDQDKFVSTMSSTQVQFILLHMVMRSAASVDDKWTEEHYAIYDKMLNTFQAKGGYFSD